MNFNENSSLDNKLEQAVNAFGEFIQTVAMLRHPQAGCPWDLKQDHQSLRRFMIEEAYEASDAMDTENTALLVEELGDVLLQVVLNAQVGVDRGEFSIVDVIERINKKMVFRHPHVFAGCDPLAVSPIQEPTEQEEKGHWRQWEHLKAVEKKRGAVGGQVRSILFSEAYGMFPATIQAAKIGRLAERIDFDWKNPTEVLAQLKSELLELQQELQADNADERQKSIREELGDVFFTLAQLCRHLGHDPEVVAADGNRKFLNRFKVVEEIAEQKGIDLKKAGMEEKEALWQEAKAQAKS